jgi:hypothetical protein
LTLPEGATLRSYLSEKLNCDPMRITKKYAGASCLGRRVYHYRDRPQPTIPEIQIAKAELDHLERRFQMRVEDGHSAPSLSPHSNLLLSMSQQVGSSVVGLPGGMHHSVLPLWPATSSATGNMASPGSVPILQALGAYMPVPAPAPMPIIATTVNSKSNSNAMVYSNNSMFNCRHPVVPEASDAAPHLHHPLVQTSNLQQALLPLVRTDSGGQTLPVEYNVQQALGMQNLSQLFSSISQQNSSALGMALLAALFSNPASGDSSNSM